MKKIISCCFISISLYSFCQTNFIPLDTLSSKEYRIKLANEFKIKYEIVNKNIDLESSKQKRIVKEIYTENQKSFFEDIDCNKFIADIQINTYLQELLLEVLSKNSINSKDYKILLSKETAVNAYNLGDGVIVINYGLLTAVENEDELVFVLCHEIGHQYLNHVKNEIENYAILSTSDDIAKKTAEIRKQKYSKSTLATNLLNSIRYKNYKRRRSKEIEADAIGFDFYKKTFRNQKNVLELLKKLEKSNIENDSVTIQDYKICFEKDNFKLKLKYFDTEESIFQTYDYLQKSDIDSLKTHPDCATRIQLLSEKIIEQKNIDVQNTKFLTFKKNSINQNLINLFNNKDYGQCLYKTLKIYKNDLENIFYKNMIYQNLEKIHLAKINYTISRYLPDYDQKNNSKSLNTFITFINNIKISDLEIIITQFKPQK